MQSVQTNTPINTTYQRINVRNHNTSGDYIHILSTNSQLYTYKKRSQIYTYYLLIPKTNLLYNVRAKLWSLISDFTDF